MSAGAKGKVFLIEKLCEIEPILNKQNPNKVHSDVFPVVYRLMDEYMAGRGKNISNEMKTAIEKLVCSTYYEQGPALID